MGGQEDLKMAAAVLCAQATASRTGAQAVEAYDKAIGGVPRVPRSLDDLTPALQALFEAYLKVEPDGDTSTFASWLDDEVPALRHAIQCDCDCHANAAVWPGPHCEQCKPGSKV